MLSGIGMWILAAFYLAKENSQSIALIVFGFLTISIGYADYKSHKDESATGKPRIAKHLTNMLWGNYSRCDRRFSGQPPFRPGMGLVGLTNDRHYSDNLLVEQKNTSLKPKSRIKAISEAL